MPAYPVLILQTIIRLDPVQLTQMAKYLETVYVSGWQSSSTASSSLEPGPDLAGKLLRVAEPK
jgi:isocitrate lyase